MFGLLSKRRERLRHDEAHPAHQERLEAEHRYQSLLESLPMSVFQKDLEGRFVFVNGRLCETLQRPVDEIIGRRDVDFHPAEVAAKFVRDDRHVIETGEMLEDVEEHVGPDGKQRYIHTLKAPMRRLDGTIIGVQGMFWDVSDRKRVEDELLATAERTRKIVDNARDAFIAMDEKGCIIDWNPQAETTFGYNREEAIGQPAVDLIIPASWKQTYNQGIDEYVKTGSGSMINRRVDIVAMRRGGQKFPAELIVTPVRMGEAVVFNIFLHDITQRKKYEEELHLAKEAAETANRAKSIFLANMSHEIRTPMNAIIGMTELLLDSELTASQRDYLKMVQESADSLMGVINDILDFSKVEAGRLEFEEVEFDLRDQLGDTIKALGHRAHRKGLELVCHVEPAVSTIVRGDPNRVRQVVMNLVSNAVKFTSKGEIVVRVSRESQLDESELLRVSVSDTGIGIPREKREHIFEAFEQADSSTTRKFGGSGLGLAIASRLVEQMGGRIWLESEIGRGSTFHFTLLLGRVEAGDVEPSYDRLKDTRVLVVDDNATCRDVLVEMLGNWRIQSKSVAHAEDALAAIERAEARGAPYNMVLADSGMPGMSGFELADQMRGRENDAPKVIMMLTACDRTGGVSRCESLGLSAYLMKPVKQSELFDAIMLTVGEDDASRPKKRRPRKSSPVRGLRVLLTEDSLVNQKLAIGMLEREGHTVAVANNGKEAVAAVESDRFDVVLMDVQMPEMDGLEATRAIRESEQLTGEHVPIIAMTAHAMKGDRERCLEAGMDEYVAKPVRMRELGDAIEKVIRNRAENVHQKVSRADDSVIDWARPLEAVDGDHHLLREVAHAFIEDCSQNLEIIRAAIGRAESDRVRHAARKLKGTLDYLGASQAAERAGQVASCDGKPNSANLNELDEAMGNVLSEVARYLDHQ